MTFPAPEFKSGRGYEVISYRLELNSALRPVPERVLLQALVPGLELLPELVLRRELLPAWLPGQSGLPYTLCC